MDTRETTKRIGAAMGFAVLITTSDVRATPLELCINGCNGIGNTLAQQVEPAIPGEPAAGTKPKHSAEDVMRFRKGCLDDCEPRFPQPKPSQYPMR